MYHQGKGVEKDLDEAAKWYEFAIEFGHGDAQHNLGLINQARLPGVKTNETLPVKRDQTEAEKYLKLTTDPDPKIASSAAMVLGLGHLNGSNGVEKNYIKADRWLKFAFKKGEKDAAYWIGMLWEKGVYGRAKKDQIATAWYLLSLPNEKGKAAYLAQSGIYGNNVGWTEEVFDYVAGLKKEFGPAENVQVSRKPPPLKERESKKRVVFNVNRFFTDYQNAREDYWKVGEQVNLAQRQFTLGGKGRPETRNDLANHIKCTLPLVDLARTGNLQAAYYASFKYRVSASDCLALNHDLGGINLPEMREYFRCLGRSDFLVDVILEHKEELRRNQKTLWIYTDTVKGREWILKGMNKYLNAVNPRGITNDDIKKWAGEGYLEMREYWNSK